MPWLQAMVAQVAQTLGNRDQARELIAAVLETTSANISRRIVQDDSISNEHAAAVHTAVERLQRGMPFAYAVGNAAFRHLLLHVDERVLIPRPETELLIDHVLTLVGETPGGIAIDIGTGSGALALALAQEASFDRVVATDVSEPALQVARANASRLAAALRTPVEFRLGSDLEPVRDIRASLIVSNPPYIAHDEASALPALVRDWEPHSALFADNHGQARYEALLRDAPQVLQRNAWMVLECDSQRAHATADIARAVGVYHNIAVHADLTGRPRILVVQYAGEHSGGYLL